MATEPERCANCGAELAEDASVCAACGTPVRGADAAEAPESTSGTSPARPAPAAAPTPTSELARRLARLEQLQESARPLDVTLPSLPDWAEEYARASPDMDRWGEVIRGVERLGQQRIVRALEGWERVVKNRLARLEAYSVDGRLERDQIEDILHAARAGDLSLSLATYQQVDRVVALKERHLDQAREELERLVSLLRDMKALGIATPEDPTEIADDLEKELRGGRLASLKQQLRALRSQAVSRLKAGLPRYVTQYGEFLVGEKSSGMAVELEAAELARGARDFARGKPEEALRRLRVLAQVHGTPPGAGPVGLKPSGSPGDAAGATAASRTA